MKAPLCLYVRKEVKTSTAEFKEAAVKLAVESDQPVTETARDLGVNVNPLHTWIGKYHPKFSS
ncbi:MAG: transposase [Endozoicomonas sp.]